jgi:anthocyanidin 3-O-glucosyltransferase
MSFGTVASPRVYELRELAVWMESSGAPFLWSLREDSRGHSSRRGFLNCASAAGGRAVRCRGGCVCGARRVGVGDGGRGRRCAHGVPPFFGDQRMNVRSVAQPRAPPLPPRARTS